MEDLTPKAANKRTFSDRKAPLHMLVTFTNLIYCLQARNFQMTHSSMDNPVTYTRTRRRKLTLANDPVLATGRFQIILLLAHLIPHTPKLGNETEAPLCRYLLIERTRLACDHHDLWRVA